MTNSRSVSPSPPPKPQRQSSVSRSRSGSLQRSPQQNDAVRRSRSKKVTPSPIRDRSRSHSRQRSRSRSTSKKPRRRSYSRSRSRSKGYSRSRRQRSRSYSRSRSRSPNPDGYRLHVADLSEEANKRDLERVFMKYGPLKEIWLASYAPFYAFVVYRNRHDAEDACESADGVDIAGRRVRVSYARPRHYGPRNRSSHGDRYRDDRDYGYRASRY